MNKFVLGFIGIILVALGYFYFTQSASEVDNDLDLDELNLSETKEENKMKQPELTIDQSKEYTAILNTSEGVIKIKLDVENTPITANNFVYLAEQGFYSDVIFHRVMKDFMIQSGDPTGTGAGGPGYRFDDEEAGLRPEYKRGVVAMANAGANTNGSQFFIMHSDVDLSPNYVIFGSVVEGLDVLDKIATAEVVYSASGELSKPVSPVVINSVEIETK